MRSNILLCIEFLALVFLSDSRAATSELIDLYLPVIIISDTSASADILGVRIRIVGVGIVKAAQAMQPDSTVKAPMVFVPIVGKPAPVNIPAPQPEFNCKYSCDKIKY